MWVKSNLKITNTSCPKSYLKNATNKAQEKNDTMCSYKDLHVEIHKIEKI